MVLNEKAKICHKCNSIKYCDIMKYERKNGLMPTPAPSFLPKLTPEEEMMISRIDMSAKVYVKKHDMPGMVGSVVHFHKDL